MKTLPWTFFILGMLLYAAVWWATDVEAGEAGCKRLLSEQTHRAMPTRHGPGSQWRRVGIAHQLQKPPGIDGEA